MELWAGNERAHRHVELAGLEGDVIALPSGSLEGGDLYALYSCGADRAARIVLADAIGHGFSAADVAMHVHQLVHRFRDLRDAAALLAALNDEFTLTGQTPEEPLRLTTVVSAIFDRDTGEFNFAYAAHLPRMLFWRQRDKCWFPLGEGLDGFPIGFIAGESYIQQSIRLEPGDLVLAASDGVTEVRSPAGELLDAEGFRKLAEQTMARFGPGMSLHDFAEALFAAVRDYRGQEEFDDDITLLSLRRTE